MIPICILTIENDTDREFMSFLYVRYHRLMYREIYALLQDPWATEDVLQLTVERLIAKVVELRTKDRDHLVNYIISACRNGAKNYLRSKGRHPELSFDEQYDAPDPESDSTAMEAELIREDDLASLSSIWPKLDERSRYLLEARYILEKDIQEIADELGVKPSSVRMMLTRARRAALELMRGEEE